MGAAEDKKKALKERARCVDNGIKEALATSNGRLFLLDLIVDAGVFRTSYDEANPHNSDFNEGSRAQGLRLLRNVQRVSPEGYVRLMQDYGEIFANERQRDTSTRSGGDGSDAAGDERDAD